MNLIHKYGNEDVPLGSWFIRLDLDHIDDQRLCRNTPPENIKPKKASWSTTRTCVPIIRKVDNVARCTIGTREERIEKAKKVDWDTTRT
ncbi:hypothetical protein TanjilG_03613 [Lupinus angustifolius]|uniref:Hexosyltransferase n=1 Tax=Lupinus angustifolius TaxID=3871 RepID=A0A4P1RW81_LUPAN|nr:hypothetical protein TanjilG_03613 [Lupinus angustifolius]